MHETLTAVNDSTVSGLGRLARFFGFSEVMGHLYGTLLLSPQPLSLDDLGDTLEISKGSVSMNTVSYTHLDVYKRQERYITVGLSISRRLLLVAHTDRDRRIRLISARELTATERIAYEHGNF